MNGKNLIHVRIDYGELRDSKKEILSTEANLIRILQVMKKYTSLRKKELRSKSSLARKLKQVRNNLKKINQTLPELEIPEIQKEKRKITKKTITKKDNLRLELEEIQRKLKKLEQ